MYQKLNITDQSVNYWWIYDWV